MLLFWHRFLPPYETPTLLMLLEGGGQIKAELFFALRSQPVDGRRFDTSVAGLQCSRLDGVAAPATSYVSVPLVRVRVSECAFVQACLCA
jgi:hypothetical protein